MVMTTPRPSSPQSGGLGGVTQEWASFDQYDRGEGFDNLGVPYPEHISNSVQVLDKFNKI
jgi:hypothetical protein